MIKITHQQNYSSKSISQWSKMERMSQVIRFYRTPYQIYKITLIIIPSIIPNRSLSHLQQTTKSLLISLTNTKWLLDHFTQHFTHFYSPPLPIFLSNPTHHKCSSYEFPIFLLNYNRKSYMEINPKLAGGPQG